MRRRKDGKPTLQALPQQHGLGLRVEGGGCRSRRRDQRFEAMMPVVVAETHCRNTFAGSEAAQLGFPVTLDREAATLLPYTVVEQDLILPRFATRSPVGWHLSDALRGVNRFRAILECGP